LHNDGGRFPANIIFDEEAGKLLDEQSGITKSGKVKENKESYNGNSNTGFLRGKTTTENQYGDEGGASRFFYCAKASKKDRNENGLIENTHPTVKPTELIKYLVKLVTPKDGICLDICEGSGTHVKAILQLNKEGFDFNYIGFENDEESFNIACQRENVNKVS
jgi:site-specific DNA-methyltransferase (adenine-specific)